MRRPVVGANPPATDETMSIQWYPGHMTKARREIATAMKTQDVVIEVLDARMPRASANPLLAAIRGDKPCIVVLSKSDLADAAVTDAWIRHFESSEAHTSGRVVALALSTTKLGDARRRIPALCHKLVTLQNERRIRAMIVGVPNVGKSTLINTLMERTVVKASNVPAVTKVQHQVVLASGIALLDNPGILWPKIEDERAALRLALCGSIPDTAIHSDTVALFAAETLMDRYPQLVLTRYKLPSLPASPMDLLHEIGRRRGGLRAGGHIDLDTASRVLIQDFRSGTLGPISLEIPATSSRAE